jgi:glycosyltransferase involved in cell wall biosynthesis
MPTIIYVGRIVATKGLEYLLEAVAKISQHISDFRLVVVGTGHYMTTLKNYCTRLGISSQVDFVGYVDEAEKMRLLRQAHVLAMPSLREGWATPVLEANACGTPAVGTDVPGVRETIIDGKTGYLVPYGDVDSLASHLLRLLLDPGLRQTMGINGYMMAQNFSLENTVKVATSAILSASVRPSVSYST